MRKVLEMNPLEKLLESKTLILNLFIQSNSVKDNLQKGTRLKSHLENPLESLKVEDFNQLNFLKLKNNSKLEFQIKIHLNKKLELLTEEDFCQFNFPNNNLNL